MQMRAAQRRPGPWVGLIRLPRGVPISALHNPTSRGPPLLSARLMLTLDPTAIGYTRTPSWQMYFFERSNQR